MEQFHSKMQVGAGCGICLDFLTNTRKYQAFGEAYKEKALSEGLFVRACPVCYKKLITNQDGWADKVRANAVSLIRERHRLNLSELTPADFGATEE